MAEEVQVDSGLQKELNDLDQKIDPNQQVAEATDTKENFTVNIN